METTLLLLFSPIYETTAGLLVGKCTVAKDFPQQPLLRINSNIASATLRLQICPVKCTLGIVKWVEYITIGMNPGSEMNLPVPEQAKFQFQYENWFAKRRRCSAIGSNNR